jgi:hypothetical protein
MQVLSLNFGADIGLDRPGIDLIADPLEDPLESQGGCVIARSSFELGVNQ